MFPGGGGRRRCARRRCCEADVTLFTVDSQVGAGEAVCVMGAAKWVGEAMVGVSTALHVKSIR